MTFEDCKDQIARDAAESNLKFKIGDEVIDIVFGEPIEAIIKEIYSDGKCQLWNNECDTWTSRISELKLL